MKAPGLLLPLFLGAPAALALPRAPAPILESVLARCPPNTRCLENFGDEEEGFEGHRSDREPPGRKKGAGATGHGRHLAALLLWLACSVCVGVYWSSKGRGMVAGFLWSLLLSPLVGFVMGMAPGRTLDAAARHGIEVGTCVCASCGAVTDASSLRCPQCQAPLVPSTEP